MKTIKVPLIDFDGTLVRCKSAYDEHQLTPYLVDYIVENNLATDGYYIVTKRGCRDDIYCSGYDQFILQYTSQRVITAHLPVTITNSTGKIYYGELSYFKSALMTYSVAAFSKLTGIKLLGISMLQDVTCDNKIGVGYTYQQRVRKIEESILATLSETSQVVLQQEEALVSIRADSSNKNKQIQQIIDDLRKVHGDDVHLDISFFDDIDSHCFDAQAHFANVKHMTFTAYRVGDTIRKVITEGNYQFKAPSSVFTKIAAQLSQKALTPKNPVEPLTVSLFHDPLIPIQVAYNIRLNSGRSSRRFKIHQIDELPECLAEIKAELSKHTARFRLFSATKIAIGICGDVGHCYFNKQFDSIAAFERMLRRKFIFSFRKHELTLAAQASIWRDELVMGHMSDSRRLFLNSFLTLIINTSSNQVIRCKQKEEAYKDIIFLINDALEPDDDVFFSFVRSRLVSSKHFSAAFSSKCKSMLDATQQAQNTARTNVHHFMLSAIFACCYEVPTIGIPMALLIFCGNYFRFFSIEMKANSAYEKYESRLGFGASANESRVSPASRIR